MKINHIMMGLYIIAVANYVYAGAYTVEPNNTIAAKSTTASPVLPTLTLTNNTGCIVTFDVGDDFVSAKYDATQESEVSFFYYPSKGAPITYYGLTLKPKETSNDVRISVYDGSMPSYSSVSVSYLTVYPFVPGNLTYAAPDIKAILDGGNVFQFTGSWCRYSICLRMDTIDYCKQNAN